MLQKIISFNAREISGEIVARVHEAIPATICGVIPREITRGVLEIIAKGISGGILGKSLEESLKKFLARSHQAFMEEFQDGF